ncbi:class I SAM-dependent methyltransferase [Acinetobacter sp. MD2]|nr:class I SAM-dependent methyltransferase [Acinetobacter sp. MD2]
MLGDTSTLPWTNLGLWQGALNYPEACRNLVLHLVDAIHLTQQDRLLDLGCGQGASLKLWQDHFKLPHFEAVELQVACIDPIQKQALLGLQHLHQGDFLKLKPAQFQQFFDVIVCIDALYHHALPDFLSVIRPLLGNHGRIAFHYLTFSKKWKKATTWQKLRIRYLLKAADIQLDHLKDQEGLWEQLTQVGFHHIKIEDLTQGVCAGFAHYITTMPPQQLHGLDGFKIKMTAKLCRQLAQDGLIEYVQVTARASSV